MNERYLIIAIVVFLLVGWGSPQAETVTVKETVIAEVPVTVEVVKEIEVTRLVEVEVTRIVEVEVEVTPISTNTPVPPPTAEASSEGVVIGEPIVIPGFTSGHIEVITFVENQNEGHYVDLGDFNISAYDADGNIIATNSALEDVPAGTTIPIVTGLNLEDKELDKIEVTLADPSLSSMSSYPDFNYVIEQDNVVGDKIVGIIANQGNDSSSFLELVVIAYDADGNILGTAFTYADDNGPGTSSPFSLSLFSFADQMDKYVLFIMPSSY